MKTNFNKVINRANTNSSKWDMIQSDDGNEHIRSKIFHEGGALPMWIADMDFLVPPAVTNALVARAKHGMYGYTEQSETYGCTVANWMKTRHGYEIQSEWIVTTSGVVPALAMLVRTFLQPGDKAIIQPPVYFPFRLVLEVNGIGVVENPLINDDGYYCMDFNDLAAKARDPQTKMLILCSPHNPVGRVWRRDELTCVATICRDNGVIVVSDEIHCDLTFSPFISFSTLEKEFVEKSVICTAASKTFNLAGMGTSNIIIPDKDMRASFEKYMLSNAMFNMSIFGRLATETAYTHGAEWLDQLLDYLTGTLDYMEKYFAKHIPQIRMIRPEGTYLVWLDCRALDMDAATLHRFFLDQARVYLEQGAIFGVAGEGFLRMNIATPRKVVKEALRRMKEAVNSLDERK